MQNKKQFSLSLIIAPLVKIVRSIILYKLFSTQAYKNRLFYILFIFLYLLTVLVLVEAMLQIFNFPYVPSAKYYSEAERKLREDASIYSYINYKFPPSSFHKQISDEFNVKYDIDDLGYIGYNDLDESLRRPILVIGDSFAYGYGVDPSKTVSCVLGGYNAGLWGKSYPVHAKVYENLYNKIDHSYVVWFIYPPHLISLTGRAWTTKYKYDVSRNRYVWNTINVYNKTRISLLILYLFGLGNNNHGYYDREFELYQEEYLQELEGAYAGLESSVKSIVKITKKNNKKLIPVIVVSKLFMHISQENTPLFPLTHTFKSLNTQIPMDKIRTILKKNGIDENDIIDTSTLLMRETHWEQYFFNRDAHWNQYGHKFMADCISSKLNSYTE